MINSININKRNSNYFSSAIIMFIMSVLLGVLVHFVSFLPTVLSDLSYFLSFSIGIFGILLYIIIKPVYSNENKVFWIWTLLSMYMFFVGVIKFGGFNFSFFVTQDMRYVMYFAIGAIFADKNLIKYYNNIMKYLGILSIIFGFIALIIYSYDISLIVNRSQTWGMSYILWWLPCSTFAYLFSYTRITGKNKIIGWATFFAYIVLGIIFLKRAVIVNGIVIFLITSLLQPKDIRNRRNSKIRIFIMLFLLILTVISFLYNSFFHSVLISLWERLINTSITGFDRYNEAYAYFRISSFWDIIIGQGIGNYVFTSRVLNSMHAGLYNLIYKGGILYVLFWIWIIAVTIKRFLNRKMLSNYGIVCLCVTISACVSMFYEFSWSESILIFGYATSISYTQQNKIGGDI